MILSEALFKELQLDRNKSLTFNVGGMPIQIDSKIVTSESWLPFQIGGNEEVEALLPAGVLQNYEVIIDYRQHTLTVAGPRSVKPQGFPVPIRINEKTGLIAVDATINGKIYPLTIDCGSGYTWLRKATVQEWLATHPDWRRGVGAVGVSNMRMADDGIEATGTIVRIPGIRLGTLELKNVGVLAIGPSRENWDLIEWYSEKNAMPVIGWLGGNVLRGFRITIDYPNRMSYWLAQSALDSHDLDQVGLTLESRSGEYFVAAIATKDGKATVEGVQAGDKLLKIDSLPTKGVTRSEILFALHGDPGDVRTLLLERNSRQFTVKAKITAF